MKKLLAILMTFSIPCFLFLIVWQSARYSLVERRLYHYDREQYRIIAENKRKVSGISVLTKPERIERVAAEELGMKKADSAEIIRISVRKEVDNDKNNNES